MPFSNKKYLTNLTFIEILIVCKEVFPAFCQLGEHKIAKKLGIVPVSDNDSGKILGPDILDVIGSSASWLAEAGYLDRVAQSMWFNYRLTEQGARIMGCLPDIIANPGQYDFSIEAS